MPRLLVMDVAREVDLPASVVKEVVETALAHIAFRAATKSVMIRGFGTFYTARRAGCVRSSLANPNETITVPTTERLALRATSRRVDDATPNPSPEPEEPTQ